MRGKLPWILLAVSLAVNLAFVAGAVHFDLTKQRLASDPSERVAKLAAELSLDANQEAALMALREKMMAGRQELRGKMTERRQKLLAELARTELDQAEVETLLRQGAERRIERFAAMAGEMHDFLASLTPEQKAAFLERAGEPDFFRRLIGAPPRSLAKSSQ
ncbi:MAG: Spy/CpxP family protein refolding chaperone [Pseudomonadota bacterium]